MSERKKRTGLRSGTESGALGALVSNIVRWGAGLISLPLSLTKIIFQIRKVVNNFEVTWYNDKN